MLGIQAKGAAISVLEKIWSVSGQKASQLSVVFAGKNAKVGMTKGSDGKLYAKVNLPAIDETAIIEASLFNNIIGFVLHELGHALYSEQIMQDKSKKDSEFLFKLVNGMEDSRIERKVIDSGIAGNSKSLFEGLINSMVESKGVPDPSMKENIPALLAIEGRRLNGIAIIVPSTIKESPYKEAIEDSLEELQGAKNTNDVIKIAHTLYERIGKIDDDREEQPEGGEGEGESEDEDEKGEEGDGKPKSGSKGKGEGEGESEGDDSSQASGGGGTSGKTFTEVNYDEFIKVAINSTTTLTEVDRLPGRTKPKIMKFNWS
jgi:hypothetical protein